jgi:AcrR family transcriptional regulator
MGTSRPGGSAPGPLASCLTPVDDVTCTSRLPYRVTAAARARRVTAREQLLAAAIEIITGQGYSGLTIAGVAAGAGLSVGSVYRHFESKAALAIEVFRREADQELAAVRLAAHAAGDPLQALQDAVATFAARALARRRLAWALLAEPVGSEVDAERLRFRRSYRELFTALIDDAITAGRLPADQRSSLTAAAVVGAVGEALVGPLAPAGADDSTGLVERITQIVVRLCGGLP